MSFTGTPIGLTGTTLLHLGATLSYLGVPHSDHVTHAELKSGFVSHESTVSFFPGVRVRVGVNKIP